MVATNQTQHRKPYRENPLTGVVSELEGFLQTDPDAGEHLLKAITLSRSLPGISNDYRWKGILVPDSDLERAVSFVEVQNDTFWDNVEAVLSSASHFPFLRGRFTPPNNSADIEDKVKYYLREGLLGEALGEYDHRIEAQWKKIQATKKRTGSMYYATPSEFSVMEEARQLAEKAGNLCEKYLYHSHALRFYEQAIYIQTLMHALDPKQECRRFSVRLLEAAQRAAELSKDNRKRDIYEQLAVEHKKQSGKEKPPFKPALSSQTALYSKLEYELHSNPCNS